MKSIYLQNKYTKWYYSIVEKAQNRVIGGYTEKHHIIPKSLGGTDEPNNLVRLTGREHYICHLLLTKMIDGNDKYKMIYAYLLMSQASSKYNKRDYKINSYIYESLKKQQKHSQETKEKISKLLTGKKRSDEARRNISEGHKGQKAWNKGKKMPLRTEEHRKKLSEAVKGHNRPQSEKAKKKISDTLKKRYENKPHHSKGRIPWNKGKSSNRTIVNPDGSSTIIMGHYREKNCLTCNTLHKKRGPYCSRSCSSQRNHAEKTKEKIAESMRDFHKTPEGIAAAKVNNRRVNAIKTSQSEPITIENFAIDIPDIPDLPEGYDIADNW